MIQIHVNGRPVHAEPGEMLLAVLRREGIRVPTLCHIDGLPPSGACRMCVVEIEGQRGLAPSCATPVQDGMKVHTQSQRVVQARRTIVELLLADHPDDCLYCVRSGNCDLRALAEELGVRRRISSRPAKRVLDVSSPAIRRDPDKCILCGKCVRVCEEIQGVAAIDFVGRGAKSHIATAFEEGLNVSSCITCGQCVAVCPTGALTEQDDTKEVLNALADPDRFVVVQHAPAISVTLGEELGLPAGCDVAGQLNAVLRRLGFDRVFDTAFSADLTIMEEASELVHRLQNGGRLPMMTSCSPGWIKYVETFSPEHVANLSTCRSPQQMLGSLIKRYFAPKQGIDPARVMSVSIMPCTAKKFEAGRPEMGDCGLADVDAVLTTRELARLIRMHGFVMDELAPEPADDPFGERTTAGRLFAATGGVMEAAVRTAYWMVTGRELEHLEVQDVRGLTGVKEARVQIDGLDLGVAVASGLGNARRLLDQLRQGRNDLHFIEVMTCPGGCIAGGGQPYGTNTESVQARMNALYKIDESGAVRVSHHNPAVQRLYDELLGAPLSSKSHELLHTHYAAREVLV